MAKIRFLVELGRLETERVNDVVDLNLGILNALIGLLGRCVGASIYLQNLISCRSKGKWGLGNSPTWTAPSVTMAQSAS